MIKKRKLSCQLDCRSCSLLIAINYKKWIIPFFLAHAAYDKKEFEAVPVSGVLVIKSLSIALSGACMLG